MESNNSVEIKLQVGVKVLIKNSEGKFLFMHRNPAKYPEMSDTWDFPGGRINPGSSLLENLQREVQEETGMQLEQNPRLIAAQDIFPDGGGRHIVRLTYVGQASGEPQLSEEHDQSQWFDLEEVQDLPGLDKHLRKLLEDNDYKI